MAECQPTAQHCPRSEALERNVAAHRAVIDGIRALLDGPTTAVRRGRQPKEYHTTVGRLLQGAAEAKGMSFPEVETAIGYTKGYLNRVCTGEFNLTRRAAIAIGSALGIDLADHVVNGRSLGLGAAPPAPPSSLGPGTEITPPVPVLPFPGTENYGASVDITGIYEPQQEVAR